MTKNQTFSLDDVETERENAFIKEHKGCVSPSAMGEKFSYTFIPAGRNRDCDQVPHLQEGKEHHELRTRTGRQP